MTPREIARDRLIRAFQLWLNESEPGTFTKDELDAVTCADTLIEFLDRVPIDA